MPILFRYCWESHEMSYLYLASSDIDYTVDSYEHDNDSVLLFRSSVQNSWSWYIIETVYF